jgi:multiple sugar transport system substrate-binding protein
MWTIVRSLILSAVVIAGALMPASAQETRIRMWSFINPDGSDPRGKVLAQIIQNFEARNPGVKVIVETQIWDQVSTKFIAAHGAGTAPDVTWLHNEQFAAALKVGAVADINELFVNKWSDAERADIDDEFWRYGATATQRYMIGHSRNYFGVMYRPSMLKEAGVSPADLGTWDGLIAAAKKLTVRDSAGNVTRWGFGQAFSTEKSTPQLFVNMLLARQGSLFDKDGRAMWSTDAGVAAMNAQLDMIRVHKVTPDNAVSISSEELFEQLVAGKYAIISGSTVRVPVLQKALGSDDLGFAPWPGDKPGTYSPGNVTGWCTCIWSKSKVIKEAAKFVEYMASREADILWVRDAGTVPIRASTIESLKDYLAQPSKQYLAVSATATQKYGWLAPLDYTIGGYREDLNKVAQNIMIRGTDTKEALQAAERDFNRRHRR